MNTFKLTLIGLLLFTLILMAGCETPKIFGNKSEAELKAKTKVQNVESQIGGNLKEKLEQVANITYGVGYALGQEENPSKVVEVAKELNNRAASLAGTPTIDEMKKMKQLVDDLTSQLVTERQRGEEALKAKDDEIYSIQVKSKLLVEAKDAEIQKYMNIAQETAMKADAIQAELNKMDGFFGFGAIWYGVKKLVTSFAWMLGIGSVLYLLLRFASMSNPLAASVFSIFDTVMSWFVNVIKVLAPKALEVAGHTATTVANKYRDAMTKMVDNIEALKEMEKRNPDKKYTIDELLSELSKAMNTDEKEMISKIKRDIGYNG